MLWAMVFIMATESKRRTWWGWQRLAPLGPALWTLFHWYVAYRRPIWQNQRTPSQAVAILSRNLPSPTLTQHTSFTKGTSGFLMVDPAAFTGPMPAGKAVSEDTH